MRKTTWKNLSIEEQRRIAALYRDGNDLAEIAASYEWTPSTLARQVRTFIQYERLFMKEAGERLIVPAMSQRLYTDYITLETDDAIIISDLEIPDADPVMLKLAFMTAVRFGIKTLIINGDFIATDQQGLTDWVSVWKETCEVTYENALGMGVRLIDAFATHFDRIIICQGNHDDRISRKTHGEVYLGMLLKGTEAEYTRYNYIWLKTRRGYMYVCHPQNFSSNSVGLGQKIYNTMVAPDGTKPHVILGHTHIAGLGKSPDNQRQIVALGTMRDPLRTRYKSTTSNTHWEWEQAFCMVRRGYITMLSRNDTDWETLLEGIYRPQLEKTA